MLVSDACVCGSNVDVKAESVKYEGIDIFTDNVKKIISLSEKYETEHSNAVLEQVIAAVERYACVLLPIIPGCTADL